MKVRVRFAPSPTGFLHIGGARTALFNWLFARHHGGEFILRIEDTDQARNSVEAVDVILDGLRWLGLDWDEGPTTSNPDDPSRGGGGPYFQSRRAPVYRKRVEQLMESGHAYAHEGAIKFRMPREAITVPDLVVGDVVRELTDREVLDPDVVIVRSDGQPVFHLVNVVDDLEMGITHVIRGEDHLSNTPKHIALFRALGAEPPRYAHIPLILNSNGSKMSKRDQGASLTGYSTEGFLPEAVVNYLCLLGWSPKENREMIPLGEVVARFDLPQILRHNARFDFQKLRWLNWEYTRKMDSGRFLEFGKRSLVRAGIDLTSRSNDYVDAALSTCKEKVQQFTDLPALAGFYFVPQVTFDPALVAAEFTSGFLDRLRELIPLLAAIEPFRSEAIQAELKKVVAAQGVKMSVFVHPLRVACTGMTGGPSLYHLLEILGKEEVIARIQRALTVSPSQA